MTISDVCIKRPVFTWVLVAIPVVLGIASYGRLGVDLFPDVDFPVCTITPVLNGVGAVKLVGGRTRAMNVIVDTDKLAAYNLSVEDVRMALLRQNLEVPGGRIDQGPRELVLRTLGRLSTPAEFNKMILTNRRGY